MVQMPYSLFVTVLLAGPLAALMGVLLGAHILHRGRTGKSPLPQVSADAIKRAFVREQKDEEPKRPAAPRMRA